MGWDLAHPALVRKGMAARFGPGEQEAVELLTDEEILLLDRSKGATASQFLALREPTEPEPAEVEPTSQDWEKFYASTVGKNYLAAMTRESPVPTPVVPPPRPLEAATGGPVGLTPEERKVAQLCGTTEEDFARQKALVAAYDARVQAQ
jgi:hypothetical protein